MWLISQLKLIKSDNWLNLSNYIIFISSALIWLFNLFLKHKQKIISFNEKGKGLNHDGDKNSIDNKGLNLVKVW